MYDYGKHRQKKGLALLWMNEVKVEVRYFSKNHINVMIGGEENEKR